MQKIKNPKSGFSILRSIVSVCCGYWLCSFLLFAGAYAIYKNAIPEQWIDILCMGSVAISALLATFFAAGNGSHRIVGSLCAGVLLYLMLFLTGEYLGGVFDETRALMIAAIILLDSVIGALLSGLVRK